MDATQNTQNLEKIGRLIDLTADRATAEENIDKKHAWLAARDHLVYAARCLRMEVPQYDRAGRHLEAARRIMAQEVRA